MLKKTTILLFSLYLNNTLAETASDTSSSSEKQSIDSQYDQIELRQSEAPACRNILRPQAYLNDIDNRDQENEIIDFCGYSLIIEPVEPNKSRSQQSMNFNPKLHALIGQSNYYELTASGEGFMCGNVELQQPDITAHGDIAFFWPANTQENQINAIFIGNLSLRTNDMLIHGDVANFSVDEQYSDISEAEYFFLPSRSHGQATLITTTDEDITYIDQGTYSTCTPYDEDWLLEGDRIALNHQEGWGEATSVFIRAGGYRVAYLPYFNFPINAQRKTGFLFPEFNNIKQPDITFPFYWNIAPNYDLEFRPRKIGGRGELLENHFRYLGKDKTSGEIQLGFINDKTFGSERRIFAWQHSNLFNDVWSASWDYHYLKEPNYFEDFGSSLTESSVTLLNRQLSLTHGFSNSSLNILFSAPLNIDEGLSESDEPYQTLPQIDYSHFNALNFGFNFDQMIQYTYFQQSNQDTLPYGERLHIQSDLTRPFESSGYFIRPKITLNHTEYWSNYRDGITFDEEQSRTLPTYTLDSGLYLERDPQSDFLNGWLQTLEPRIKLQYTPFEAQDTLPLYDAAELTFDANQLFRDNRFSGYDRIGDTKSATLFVHQRWLDPYDQEKFSLGLGQIFYFEDRKLSLEDTDFTEDSSPMVGTLNWQPTHKSRLGAGITWDAENNQIEEGSMNASHINSDRHLYHLNYRFSRDNTINQIDSGIAIPISRQWTWFNKLNYDINEHQPLEHLTGFIYNSCCWRSTIAYQRRVETNDTIEDDAIYDYALMLQIELKGLGSVGEKINDMLLSSFPGLVIDD